MKDKDREYRDKDDELSLAQSEFIESGKLEEGRGGVGGVGKKVEDKGQVKDAKK